MGFWQSLLKFILGFLLSTLLLASIMAFSLSQLTGEANAKDFFVSTFSKIVPIDAGQETKIKDSILQQCETRKVEAVSIVINPQTNESIDVSCAELKAGKSFVQIMSEQMFSKIYYKKYDCAFISCLQSMQKEGPFVIFSALAHSFFSEIYIYFITGTVLIIVLSLLLVKPWYSSLKSIGKSFVLVGLPGVVLFFVRTFLLQQIAGQTPLAAVLPSMSKVLNLFVRNFVVVFAVGLVFFATGKIIEKKKVKEEKRSKKKK